MKPEISIIMPVYNAEKFLKGTIESIINQDFTDFELIIINDGSTDNSAQICDYYREKDSRVVVIHKENEGICKARNLGLDIAKGNYVGFCDHDDVFSDGLIGDNYKMLKDSKADWIKFGKIEYIGYEDKILKVRKSDFVKRTYDSQEMRKNILNMRCENLLTYVWDSLFSMDIIRNHSLKFDENFKLGNEDIDFCQNYLKYASKLVINNKNYYRHYTRIGISASSKFSNDKIYSYIYLQKKSEQLYNELGIDLSYNSINYQCIITKYIICNIYNDLNNASKVLSDKEKINIIKSVAKEEILSKKLHYSIIELFKRDKKLAIYNLLFRNKMYCTLLRLDKCSRSIIYRLRVIKNSFRSVR